MKKYTEKYFWDFILCVLISTGLSFNIFAGYEMTDPLSGNFPATAGAVVAITALLFLAYYDRRALIISVIAEALALIAAIVILQHTGVFSEAQTIDGNPLLFWIIVISTSIVVFWAARTRTGLAILFLAGTIMTAAFDLLQFPVCKWGLFALSFGVFVLFLYRVYCISLIDSDKGNTSFSIYFTQSVIVGMAALVLASGCYYGIIKPMAPPTDQLNLTKKLISMDILKEMGVSSTRIIYSDDTVRTSPNENQQNTNKGDNNSKKHNEQNKEGTIVHGKDPMTAKPVTFPLDYHIMWITAASILVIIVLAIVIKLLLRKKWYSDLLKKSKEDCAMELYNYFLKKIRKTGFKRPNGLTLHEYAYDLQNKLEDFSVGDANFLSLTQIYTRILYGCQNISEDEWEQFTDFYKEFNRNLKGEMGSFRYFVHFFSV
ncbi:MAG: DUF4129 domain-containing protein [Syntrophomonas sp.]